MFSPGNLLNSRCFVTLSILYVPKKKSPYWEEGDLKNKHNPRLHPKFIIVVSSSHTQHGPCARITSLPKRFTNVVAVRTTPSFYTQSSKTSCRRSLCPKCPHPKRVTLHASSTPRQTYCTKHMVDANASDKTKHIIELNPFLLS